MSYKYPRERKEIITINGGFDPCRNTTEMAEMWDLTGCGWRDPEDDYGLKWTQVTAPGGIGGYAHKFDGRIKDVVGLWGQQGISVYRNAGFQYYISPFSPYYWKIRAEFRLRIELDQLCNTGYLSHCLGFWLDGNVMTVCEDTSDGSGAVYERIGVFFNKAMGKIAITTMGVAPLKGGEVVTEVSQTLNYDQYYDVRIEWSFDWFNDPQVIHVDVWLDNVQKINFDVNWPDYWRCDAGEHFNYHQQLGRCGPAINLEYEGVATQLDQVIGYFKDIVISQVAKVSSWQAKDNIIQTGKVSNATLRMISERAPQFGEGSDVNIWRRNKIADQWEPRFRGIIREVDRPNHRKVLLISAEGYETLLYGDKTQNITHTAQTATQIIQDTINNPDKGEFDVTTYVESTSANYNRNYPQNPKMDIIQEMSGLEGFIAFVDHVNYWHFQSYRTNQLPNHLIYGQSKILKIKVTEVFVRRPNLIRVIGKGFVAERELAVDSYASGSNIVRNFNRFDLETQLEVDDALNFYCSLLNEPLRIVTVTMRADHSLQKGNLIRLTSTKDGIKNQQFLISSVGIKKRSRMTLGLLEAKPLLPALISDLSMRTSTKEGEMFPQDETSANPTFNVEGVATVNITATFEIEFDSAIVRSGDMIVTDAIINHFIRLWNLESVVSPREIAYGTGTTAPLFSDTSLDTQTGRAAATISYIEEVGNAIPISGTPSSLYRAVQYELDVVNPTGITEIGLFNNGATMACRAVFASYTETGTVTFRIKMRVEPTSGFCYITPWGRNEMVAWLGGDRINVMRTHTHIAHFAFNSFVAPFPDSAYRSTQFAFWAAFVPSSVAVGTYTRTKILDRNMIKLQFDYPDYDFTNDKSEEGGSTSPQERFLAVYTSLGGNREERQLVILSHRSTKIQSDYDGSSCRWIIWIKIVPGETEY